MEEAVCCQDKYVFLSPEWVKEVTRVIQGARKSNAKFRKLAQTFSLCLTYLISDIPQELEEQYGGKQAVVFVRLEKGTVQKLKIGPNVPEDKADFMVSSSYNVAKDIFQGELNPATSFMGGHIKIEPMEKVYQRPRFAATSIVTGNLMLKIARQVPTEFLPVL